MPVIVTVIVGPNGAGKTTTVETCEGLPAAPPQAPSINGLNPVRDAAQLHPRIGVILLQSGGVPSGAKATETLHHFAKFYQHPRPD